MQFDQHGCEILDKYSGEVLGEATKIGDLYYVDIANICDQKKAKSGNLSSNDMKKGISSITKNKLSKK